MNMDILHLHSSDLDTCYQHLPRSDRFRINLVNHGTRKQTLAGLGGLHLNEIGYHGLPSSMGHGDQGPGLKWLWAEKHHGFNLMMAPIHEPPKDSCKKKPMVKYGYLKHFVWGLLQTCHAICHQQNIADRPNAPSAQRPAQRGLRWR